MSQDLSQSANLPFSQYPKPQDGLFSRVVCDAFEELPPGSNLSLGWQDPARVAYHCGTRRNVFHDYSASANGAVVADDDISQYDCVRAYIHIVPNAGDLWAVGGVLHADRHAVAQVNIGTDFRVAVHHKPVSVVDGCLGAQAAFPMKLYADDPLGIEFVEND
ncbi:hypothetical protein NZK81_00765 [Novosphingobium sp. HK4-1]|uniref:Uncharacterized protein n=1 Tax=Novosphingobium mangrovi (ex Huang et al. 2023) TaxID=2976432 RepID=A0ABT2HZU3_9SPHN|nr:hypothetical protein [Novosphingobium mangrovi (ex Huang et al. 2023)]MCT2398070.1 hypothetical protein [Novosphingobium mangrovi (ex Huang et al. 2023)]